MKHINRKRFLGTFALLLVCGLLTAACSQGQTAVSSDTAAGESVNEETISKEEQLYASLPEGSYEGVTFTIAQYVFSHLDNMSKYYVTLDESDGEKVCDALYNVTIKAEERLNVDLFTDVYDNRDAMKNTLRNSLMAGDAVCDIFLSLDTQSLLNEGLVQSISGIAAIDFDKPWWNSASIDAIRTTEKIYHTYGTLSMQPYANLDITLFNKQVAENIGMEDLYALAREGGWTMDVMNAYMTQASRDVDGDGKFNVKKGDIFGFSASDPSLFAYLYGGNISLFERDDSGNITYNGTNEHFYDVFEKVANMSSDKQCYYHAWSTDGVSQFHLMSNDQVLFNNQLVVEMEQLRDMVSDYGVLPNPKYSEGQEEYISYIYNDSTPISLPITVTDTEYVGTVLENLVAETYRGVRMVYLEDMLEQKLLRDEESIEMMEMIIDSKTIIDPCWFYNWGGIRTVIFNALTKTPDRIISSMEEISEQLLTEMQTAIDSLQ